MQQREPRVRLHIAERNAVEIPPSDTCNIIECICTLLGAGYMLSYNVLITPIDFYNAIYPSYKSSIMYYIVPIHRTFLLISILLMITPCFTYYNSNTRHNQTNSSISWYLLIAVPFFIIFLCLSMYPYLPQYIQQTEDESMYFMILLVICSFCGFFSGIIQCAVTAFCNYLPSQYMKASISGQAMAGIIVCILRIITKLIDTTDYKLTGKIYFLIGGFFNVLCAVLFVGINKTKLIKYYFKNDRNKSNQDYSSRYRAIKFNSKYTQRLIEQRQHAKMEKKFQNNPEIKMYSRKKNDEERDDGRNMSYCSVFKEIRSLSIGSFIVMMVTFLYFPGLILAIKSQHKIFQNDNGWFGIILITEYNVFDYFGRQFLSKYRLCINARNVSLIAIVRGLIVYPLFVVLYKEYIVNDILLHCVNIIGAASNGYLICLIFIFLSNVSDANRESQNAFNHISAIIMTLSLNLGILFGSIVAIVVQKYLL